MGSSKGEVCNFFFRNATHFMHCAAGLTSGSTEVSDARNTCKHCCIYIYMYCPVQYKPCALSEGYGRV